METKIYTKNNLSEAAEKLKKGELIAFPTETVYGLGADATNDQAVKRIYAAKGRPSDNPLISHVSSIEQVEKYASFVPDKAKKLMETFWPGPLTIILNKKEKGLAPTVTANLSSASFRMPNNPTTIELIDLVGKPLAGPSANTSGRPSPTSATHVFHDLNGKISGILDDGPTDFGIESTVLDLTNPENPLVLRPGTVTPEEIEAVIGPIQLDVPEVSAEDAPKSPGMKYRHYSPSEPVYIVSANGIGWQEAIRKFHEQGEKIGLLATSPIIENFQSQVEAVYSLGDSGAVKEAAKRLYAGLRYFEDTGATVILAEEFPTDDIGVAYMNRLEKSAGYKKI